MEYFIILCLASFGPQIINAQILRPPFNLLNRPETIIESPNFTPPCSPTVIREPPINSLVPLPNAVAEPRTTIITDCSPTICKNLANTIQLMIVCNLIQNSRNSELAMQLATPILNEVMSSPTFSCGCPNPIAPNLISPNIVASNSVTPNFIGNVGPLSPRVVAPNVACPNTVAVQPNIPLGGQLSNTNGLLNSLIGLLGNIQG